MADRVGYACGELFERLLRRAPFVVPDGPGKVGNAGTGGETGRPPAVQRGRAGVRRAGRRPRLRLKPWRLRNIRTVP